MASVFQPLFTLRKHTAAVQTCAFSPAARQAHGSRRSQSINSLLFSGDSDGTVILWDLDLRQPIFSFHAATEAYRQEDLAEEMKRHGGTLETKKCENGENEAPSSADGGSAAEDDEDGMNASPALLGKWRQRRGQVPGVMHTDFIPFRCECEDHTAGGSSKSTTLFYTQCRNQCLYLWSIRTPRMDDDSSDSDETADDEHRPESRDCSRFELRLVHTLRVPQHAFCSVPFAMVSPNTMRFPVPHDNCGIVSVWDLTLGGSPTDVQAAHQTIVDAGDGIKCGQIMSISWRDPFHMAVSFESGHIVLYGISGSEEQNENHSHGVPSKKLYGMRLFAEPAVACMWNQERVLVSSAEGVVHCYLVENAGATQAAPVRVTLVWEAALNRGVGCCQLTGPLAIIGCWDSTVRMYDARYGSVVTVAPFHAGTVNQVVVHPSCEEEDPSPVCIRSAIHPSTPGAVATPQDITNRRALPLSSSALSVRKMGAFHFDSRQQGISSRRAKASASTDDPYVFASVAADGSIAIWKVVLSST